MNAHILCVLGCLILLAPASTAAEKPARTPEQQSAQLLHDEALRAFQRGDLTAARTGFEKALSLAPDNAPALINLALVEQRAKNFTTAATHLKKLIRADPENATAWLLLGIGAYEEGKTDAAHAHLAQAVLHAPKNIQARIYLGAALSKKGWYAAAEDELHTAIELDPKNSEAHYNLALLALQRNPPAVETARTHYKTALDLGAKPDPALAKKLAE